MHTATPTFQKLKVLNRALLAQEEVLNLAVQLAFESPCPPTFLHPETLRH